MSPEISAFNQALKGRRCSVARLEYSWVLSFGDRHTLTIEAPWRIVQDNRIAFASSDDGQKFGLPELIDGEAVAGRMLAGRHIASLKVFPDTADISLYFGTDTRLDVFNHSSGYESWHACLPNERGVLEIIGGGGGEITSFFVQGTTVQNS